METEKEDTEYKMFNHELVETQESIGVIQSGKIDAFVFANEKSLKVFTEKSADKIYRILIEKMHEGAVTLNEHWIILYCNACFAEMVNLPLEKIIGTSFQNLLDKSTERCLFDLLRQCGENAQRQELFLNTADGKLLPVMISVTILPVEGTFTLSIIVTDLSTIKKNQEQISIQKELLEEAEKITEIGSWIVDLKTNEVTLSKGLYMIYGLNPEISSLNISPYELIHQKDLAQSKIIFDNAVKGTGSFDTYAQINIPPGNKEKILHIKGKVIYKDAKPYQFIGTTQDVTLLIHKEQELRNNNKELAEAKGKIAKLNQELEYKVMARTRELELAYERLQECNDELEEINNSKDKFISIISHDLRNPISAIIASSEFMINNAGKPQKEETLNFSRIIHSSSRKIVEQLNALVEWSKEKTKITSYTPKALNLNECFLFSLELVQSIADKKNIRIINNIEKHIEVKANPLLLKSIFQNLITNSIKFTPEAGEIKIEACKEGNAQIKVSIKDSGIGMSEEVQKNIFSNEANMAKSGINPEKSRGLGLILVKDFVEKHHGKVWVESNAGEGSTFYFTLPSAD
jgi:PAS domain S-box-containing protein